MPWSPRGQVTAASQRVAPQALCGGRGSPSCPRSLSSPFHPFAPISTQAPLPSSESRGLACGLWVTRGVSLLRVSAPQPSQVPRGDTSNSRRDQDLRSGRRQQSLPSPTVWQERSAETRHTLRTEIRRLHLAHGYELNAGSHLLPHALSSPRPTVPAVLPPCL